MGCIAWAWIAVAAGLSAGEARFPEHRALAEGPWRIRLLPGHREFVFTLYGAPGDPRALRDLVEVLKARGLANGFDPGPAARASSKSLFDELAKAGWPVIAYPGFPDMQVMGGRCVLGPADRESLSALDGKGLFWAVQLGEWGYYFHNLSCNEGWWRDVYGADLPAMRHLMKPAGLAGYDRRPADRRECYEALRTYYRSRSGDLLDRTISVTGHSHYEAYAAEWGARCIGLELGENIAFTQSKIAFARGASRRWDRPFSIQVSPWLAGACTTAGPLRIEGGGARGLDAGHSLDFYRRMWLHAWFAGAALVTPENSLAIFFESAAAPWTLTEHGREAAAVFAFTRGHDRGVPFTPVAVVLDHLAGYNGYMGKPWGILEPTAGDREVEDLLVRQLFPGSDGIHEPPPEPGNPESSFLRPTPHGETFDVLLSDAPAEVLGSYPAILLAGEIEFDDATVGRLEESLARGSRLLLGPRHRAALGDRLVRLERRGAVEVLDPWTSPATGRPGAIPGDRLRRLLGELLPVGIEGDPVRWQVNRTPAGWAVEVANDRGVIKEKDRPARIDPGAEARIVLTPRVPWEAALEWRSGRTHPGPAPVRLRLGPGEAEFVEFRLPRG